MIWIVSETQWALLDFFYLKPHLKQIIKNRGKQLKISLKNSIEKKLIN